MSDIRVCRICDQQFDFDNLPDIRIVDADETNFTFIDEKKGVCHVLMSRKKSAERIERVDEVKYEIRQPEQPVVSPKAPANEEPHPPGLETLAEPEQPITVENVVESEFDPEAEPTAEEVEYEGHIEEVNSEFGSGFIKVDWRQRRPGLIKVIFDRKDIVTFGEVKAGKMVRFQIDQPDPGGTMHRAKEVKIYQDVDE